MAVVTPRLVSNVTTHVLAQFPGVHFSSGTVKEHAVDKVLADATSLVGELLPNKNFRGVSGNGLKWAGKKIFQHDAFQLNAVPPSEKYLTTLNLNYDPRTANNAIALLASNIGFSAAPFANGSEVTVEQEITTEIGDAYKNRLMLGLELTFLKRDSTENPEQVLKRCVDFILLNMTVSAGSYIACKYEKIQMGPAYLLKPKGDKTGYYPEFVIMYDGGAQKIIFAATTNSKTGTLLLPESFLRFHELLLSGLQ